LINGQEAPCAAPPEAVQNFNPPPNLYEGSKAEKRRAEGKQNRHLTLQFPPSPL
jgi:hypothetical protein